MEVKLCQQYHLTVNSNPLVYCFICCYRSILISIFIVLILAEFFIVRPKFHLKVTFCPLYLYHSIFIKMIYQFIIRTFMLVKATMLFSFIIFIQSITAIIIITLVTITTLIFHFTFKLTLNIIYFRLQNHLPHHYRLLLVYQLNFTDLIYLK